jgi:hypothetical protein
MEPLEYEVRRGRESRDRTGVSGSARQASPFAADPGMRSGDGPPGRRTGPQSAARQDYLDQPAPPHGPVPEGSANRSGPMPQAPRTAGRPHRPPAQPTGAATPSAGPYGYDGSGYGYSNGGGSGYSNGYAYGGNDGAGSYTAEAHPSGPFRAGPYPPDPHPSGPIPTGPYPPDAHPSGPIPTGPYPTDAHPSGPIPTGLHRTDAHPSGPIPTGLHRTDAHPSSRRPEVMAPRASSPGWDQTNGRGPHSAERGHSARNEPALRGQVGQAVDPRNGDSVSMVARILSVADYEAASITQQASYQAAMITRQVAHEATEIREAARHEADQIMQQASMQASAVLEAAQMEAAEVRAAVTSMQTELSDFAARFSNTLPHPVLPRIPPAGRPAVSQAMNPMASPAVSPAASPFAPPQAPPRTMPARKPPARPAGRAAVKTAAPPVAKPATRAAGKSASGQGRQRGAMRFAAIATSALFLFAVIAGITEIHLHGFDFFVFRSTGTGETGPGGLPENEGPGQPDAPKPTPSHIKVQPRPHSTVAVHTANNKKRS